MQIQNKLPSALHLKISQNNMINSWSVPKSEVCRNGGECRHFKCCNEDHHKEAYD